MSVAMRDMSKSAGDGAEGLVKNAILIAGPTASGKSALALEIARQTGGCIVNTDSMQVYSVLNVLTARPGADELAAVRTTSMAMSTRPSIIRPAAGSPT